MGRPQSTKIQTRKFCPKCGITKEIINFTKRKTGNKNYQNYCTDCKKIVDLEYKKKNSQKLKDYRKKRYYRDKEIGKVEDDRLKTKYGITLNQYNDFLIKQNYTCAICCLKSDRKLAVDHCHETRIVRGLLCLTCNTALGSARDDINILNNMIKYLIKFEEKKEINNDIK